MYARARAYLISNFSNHYNLKMALNIVEIRHTSEATLFVPVFMKNDPWFEILWDFEFFKKCLSYIVLTFVKFELSP